MSYSNGLNYPRMLPAAAIAQAQNAVAQGGATNQGYTFLNQSDGDFPYVAYSNGTIFALLGSGNNPTAATGVLSFVVPSLDTGFNTFGNTVYTNATTVAQVIADTLAAGFELSQIGSILFSYGVAPGSFEVNDFLASFTKSTFIAFGGPGDGTTLLVTQPVVSPIVNTFIISGFNYVCQTLDFSGMPELKYLQLQDGTTAGPTPDPIMPSLSLPSDILGIAVSAVNCTLFPTAQLAGKLSLSLLNLSGTSILTAIVDNILSTLVVNAGLGAAPASVFLDGGCQPPSPAGVADALILTGFGWNVQTN
jgi:hypothetical protein